MAYYERSSAYNISVMAFRHLFFIHSLSFQTNIREINAQIWMWYDVWYAVESH